MVARGYNRLGSWAALFLVRRAFGVHLYRLRIFMVYAMIRYGVGTGAVVGLQMTDHIKSISFLSILNFEPK